MAVTTGHSGVIRCQSGLVLNNALGKQEHAPGEYADLDTQPLLTKRAALLMYRLMWPQ